MELKDIIKALEGKEIDAATIKAIKSLDQSAEVESLKSDLESERGKSAGILADKKKAQAERDEQVKILSEEFGKKKRSIIAKLSRMDLYVAKVRATKTGEPVEHKKDIVAAIAENVGISVTLLTSLSKATKADLQSLAKAVSSS